MPWALQVSWLELGQGTGTGSFPWVAPSENPRRAGVCGTVGSSAQGSGGPRAEAGHRLLASLFSFLRKNINSFMSSDIDRATTMWHVPFLARRKQSPCAHGAYALVWKETSVNIIINSMLKNESAKSI